MITTIPLPSPWRLLGLGALPLPDPARAAAPWRRRGESGWWLSRTSWSLAVIADAWAAAHGRRPVVAVPEFICNQSLWPLRQGRADLVFYPVRADTAAPDWPACRQLGAVDLFVLVHPFGWPGEAAEAARFVAERGALLIEDAAHVLRPIPGIGEYGAVVCWSPHKLLPLPDGAVLVARSPAADIIPFLAPAMTALGAAHPPTGPWRLRRLIQTSPMGQVLMRLRPGGQPDFAFDPAATALPGTPQVSPAALRLVATANLAEAARFRAANAAALLEAIAHLADWHALLPLRPDIAPYRLVMRCADPDVAAGRYARLRAAGLPVETWPAWA